jgi:dTDP-3-amino-3,4,6-trideoxy-alpha-D-glucose transaminase
MELQQAAAAIEPVPFLDLASVHRGLKDDIVGAISELIDEGVFTNGPAVAAFERAFAAYCGTDICVGTGSGLDALRLGLLAAGIEEGDEVIVPAMTFVATLEAVTQAGGRPVLADVDERDQGLDAAAAEATITARTRYLLPVHLYGQLTDVLALRELAARHGLGIVEDACQAHGAERDGWPAGTVGVAAAFSFYPGKNLGAFGDAGALVTRDAELAARVRALREHGQYAKYTHELEGYTSRLDTLQAVVLLRKLPLLEAWNDQRRAAAAFYSAALDGIGDLRTPFVPEGSRPVWHLYVVRTSQRDQLAEFLAARGIATGKHYPEPPHLSRAYGSLGYRRGAFPVAEMLAEESLSLPLFPGITEEQLDSVVTAISDFFAHG